MALRLRTRYRIRAIPWTASRNAAPDLERATPRTLPADAAVHTPHTVACLPRAATGCCAGTPAFVVVSQRLFPEHWTPRRGRVGMVGWTDSLLALYLPTPHCLAVDTTLRCGNTDPHWLCGYVRWRNATRTERFMPATRVPACLPGYRDPRLRSRYRSSH